MFFGYQLTGVIVDKEPLNGLLFWRQKTEVNLQTQVYLEKRR